MCATIAVRVGTDDGEAPGYDTLLTSSVCPGTLGQSIGLNRARAARPPRVYSRDAYATTEDAGEDFADKAGNTCSKKYAPKGAGKTNGVLLYGAVASSLP